MNKHILDDKLTSDDSPHNFNAISISLASPEIIRSWSYGEVKKPETINYRTLKPERGGLFCAQIFGPVKDYTCLCGKYKTIKYKDIVCEKCGVEITSSVVRRERMGHIELQVPIAHIWFLKSLPSRIGALLDHSIKQIESVLYFEKNIIIDAGMTKLVKGSLIGHRETQEIIEEYGAEVTIGSGAEAIYQMLKQIDLQVELFQIEREIESNNSQIRLIKLLKKRSVLRSFLKSGQRPEWMVITALPVLPPDLRPLVPLEGGRFASSDLNDLYRHVINRNNRLKRLITLSAPEIILRNEKRMLQEAVDALLDNSRANKIFSHNKKNLKSLSSNLKGKQGRFRQNLLGKRVDYSGRSVITVGPHLRFYQCGLPKLMALELFKPFVFAEIKRQGYAPTILAAQKIFDQKSDVLWDILESVIYQHPVLLNRAPTLHRLSIQAFEPVLVEGKSIQLHPLVCTPFNADFDGDSMAVHIPLSIESQLEARLLMMSSNNIKNPGTGDPIINPSQDIILGLYYASMERAGVMGEGRVYDGYESVKRSYDSDKLHIHARIKARIKGRMYDTTTGRVIISQILPQQLNFDIINKLLTSKVTQAIINLCYDVLSQKDIVIFMDKMMNIGHKFATISGCSISLGDMIICTKKDQIIQQAQQSTYENFDLVYKGLISEDERYNRNTSLWSKAYKTLKEQLIADLKYDPNSGKSVNPIYLMIDSGARGSIDQYSQITGIRGLMSKPNGEVIETPIVSNFKEGLNPLEYFISISGGRKGLIDTALKTANAGYLTRRLVDVAQDTSITMQDCGTKLNTSIMHIYSEAKIITTLAERIRGRTLAEDLKLKNGEIIKSGSLIDKQTSYLIEESGLSKVRIFSIYTCEAPRGVCAKCYGVDLSTGKYPNLGSPVGILAAHGLGEPGTQLTMRTKHTGGVATGSISQAEECISNCEGICDLKLVRVLEDRKGNKYIISQSGKIRIWDINKNQVLEDFPVPYGAKLYYQDGDTVKHGDMIASWIGSLQPTISEVSGKAIFHNLENNSQVQKSIDPETGLERFKVINTILVQPKIDIVENGEASKVLFTHLLPNNAIVYLQPNTYVHRGDIIYYTPTIRGTVKSQDIVGGLPAVINIFEARLSTEPKLLAEVDGTIEVRKIKKAQKVVLVKDDGTEFPLLHSKTQDLLFDVGSKVKKGDILCDGGDNFNDILRILGIEELGSHMVKDLKRIFANNGVNTHEKHMEIIIRAMTRQALITRSEHHELLEGELRDIYSILEANKSLANPILFERQVMGITKASLNHPSFLSAASFQETDKILIDAALNGKTDMLYGIKENVITGRFIPAGTGYRDSTEKVKSILKQKNNQ